MMSKALRKLLRQVLLFVALCLLLLGYPLIKVTSFLEERYSGDTLYWLRFLLSVMVIGIMAVGFARIVGKSYREALDERSRGE